MLSHERLSRCLCQFVIDLLMFLVAVIALYFFPRLFVLFFLVLSHVWLFGIKFFLGIGFCFDEVWDGGLWCEAF